MASSGMILSWYLNSVGAPQLTPAICPIHPAFILSRYSLTGSRRQAPSSGARGAAGRKELSHPVIRKTPRAVVVARCIVIPPYGFGAPCHLQRTRPPAGEGSGF